MLIHELLTGIGLTDDQADVYRALVLTDREPRARVPLLAKLAVGRAEAALERLLEVGLLLPQRAEDGLADAVGFASLDALEGLVKGSARPVDAGLAEWVISRIRRYRDWRQAASVTIIMPSDRPETWRERTGLLRSVHMLLPALDLRIGTVCNFNCLYCLVGHEKKSIRPLTDLQHELRIGRRRNLTRVNLTGGEPTLHPRLGEILSGARKLGYTGVTLVTNAATLSYKGRVERLLESGVDRFGFSFDSPHAAVIDHLVQRQGMGAPVMEGIRRVLDAAATRPEVHAYGICVVATPNLPTLGDTTRWLAREARDRGVQVMLSLDFVIAEENAWEHRDQILPRMSDAVPAIAEAVRSGSDAGLVVTHRNLPPCVTPPDVRDRCLDDHIHIARLFDVPGGGYDEEAIDFYRVKRPSCRSCRFFATCWGVHMSYVHEHGFDEFRPQ